MRENEGLNTNGDDTTKEEKVKSEIFSHTFIDVGEENVEKPS